MRVLLTGATGFAGSHLADFICQEHQDWAVYVLARWRSSRANLRDCLGHLTFVDGDLLDAQSIQHAIAQVRPDWVFHLAAESYVAPSWQRPSLYFDVNVGGTIRLLEALRKYRPNARIHIAGSGEEYGLVRPDEVPITEDNTLRPMNPYAVSKVAQGQIGLVYHRSYGQDIVRTRAFNHIGPRRENVFALASWACQLARMKLAGTAKRLYIGNLEPVRDFTHVRDIVRGYWLALEHGRAGEVYCLGSGIGHSLRDVVLALIEVAGLSGQVELVEDKSRMRPTEVPLLIADAGKIARATGWEPMIPFEQTLREIYEYWYGRVLTATENTR